jgi:hypothetical protein
VRGPAPGHIPERSSELGRPQRTMHPILALLLAAIFLLTVLVDPTMALLLAALFGSAWLLQRSRGKSGG